MDKKVKYYRAINWQFMLCKRISKTVPHFQLISELQNELDAIFNVLIFDTDLSIDDKRKITNCIRHTAEKATYLPR